MGATEALAHYIRNPEAYVRDIIGAVPTEQQAELLRAVATERAVASRSGHGIGKTTVAAWAILWFLPLHPYARVPCTAPTGHQLDDTLWPEVRYWIDRSPPLQSLLEWTKTRLSVRGYEETWFAVPRSAAKAENLQGFHGRHVLFVVDEASGVEQEIMEVVEGALTNAGAKLLMTGNPTRLSGTFYDAFHKDRGHYRTFTFSSVDSPLVSDEYCERIATRYGRESDVYRVRVLGLFPKGEPDTFIRLDEAEGARGRTVPERGPWFIGVDVARFGDDETVIYFRRGFDVHEPVVRHGIATTWTAGEVVNVVKRIRATGYDDTIEVRVDDTGIGGAVTDMLNEQSVELDIDVIPVNFGAAGDEDHADRAALMWGRLKEFMGEMSLPDDEQLLAQLSTRKYKIQPDGRIKLERKEDMKKRGLPSPDRADALALCFDEGGDVGVSWV